MRYKQSEASIRQAERRQREDDAPRLHTIIPSLTSLRLQIDELRDGNTVAEGGHVRPIVIESAPALFELPCGDRSCKDGGHDMTRVILQGLEAGEEKLVREHACRGAVGSTGAECTRTLRVTVTATYSR